MSESCVTSASVQSTENSTYSFGVFLPKEWNGRFLAVGNGGFAGSVSWADMKDGMDYGFAVVSTDAGTHMGGMMCGAHWAEGAPEKVTDWGWRALHQTVVYGKQIVKAYYGADPKFSYYRGCSTGGRQGFREAQLFPEDFDGIVAGAPAWWTTHLQLANMKVGLYNLPVDAPNHIPNELFPIIQAEVMKQCDPQDGLKDNIISDPSTCKFRAETLLCGGTVTTNCLTPEQIDTLNHIYSPWVEANQTFVFPPLAMSSEFQWPMAIGEPEPSSMGTEYVKYMLGKGPSWRWQDWEPSIIALSDEMNPGNANADDFDMRPFKERGGKLLHYHGWSDGSIPAGSSEYLYKQIEQTLKPKGVELDDFYKFFYVPGMGHCGESAPETHAPWNIGAGGVAMSGMASVHSVPGFVDADHDVLLAVMRWVENGTAPTQMIGTAWKDEQKPGEVYQQRPLCMYPEVAKYRGTGDVKSPESWECKGLY
ncbi:feruloyl esterase B precursor [Aulographum hederae CBS 113979]|uniref:Carboxylic ester hydrolase n=1 Tax=Aulographum hederae CBS 113979 TaxID=1176131 RepID=A0A6G1H5X4_9PEZI|nr:feruloyl esterase B precursor [Aulographum hederae CBS 113979]